MKVNLWFARDEQNEIVSIVDSTNENTYTCPICSSKVIPKALESKKVTPHYAHVDVDKCNSESMLHWWFKHKFIERGDTFKIKTDDEIEYACKDFDTEVTFQLDNGIYRPDLVIYTECGQEIVFEMANTNKKKVQDYIDKWIELDKLIVEVDIKSLQNADEIKTFDALYYNGKCFNFNKRDGGYYNTIGKLKEQMKQDGKYDIELVKKLDWFWNEVATNKYDESSFINLESLLKDTYIQDVLSSVFSNNKHSEFKDKFNDYKKKKLIQALNLSENNEIYEISISTPHKYRKEIFLNSVNISLFSNYEQYCIYSEFIIINNLTEELIRYNLKKLEKVINESILNSFIIRFNSILEKDGNGIRMHKAYKSIYLHKTIGSKKIELKTSIQDSELNESFWLNKVNEFKSIHATELNLIETNNYVKELEKLINHQYKDNFISFKTEIINNNICVTYEHSLSPNSEMFEYLREILNLSVELTSDKFDEDVFNFIKGKLQVDEVIRKMSNHTRLWKKDDYHDIISIVDDVLQDVFKESEENELFELSYNIHQQSIDIHIFKIYESKSSFLITIDTSCITTYKELYERDLDNEWKEVNYNNSDLYKILHKIIMDKVSKCKFEFYCYDCDEYFIMNNGEVFYFINKGFNLPKRCKSCRQKRKLERNGNN